MQMLVTVLVAAGASMEPDAVTFEVHHLWATGANTDVQVEHAGSDLVFRAVPKQRAYLRGVEFDPPSENADCASSRARRSMPSLQRESRPHASRASGALLCEARKPRVHRLRTASAFAADFLIGARLL